MKDKRAIAGVVGASIIFIGLIAGVALSTNAPDPTKADDQTRADEKLAESDVPGQGTCGKMDMGRFMGEVVYDEEKGYYFLQLRGARFPFKASPADAQDVPLEAAGNSPIEKNTTLMYGIMGRDVLNTTILVSPDEEEEAMPAATDIARYMRIVNPKKLAGLAYTKQGGKLKQSVMIGPQVQSLDDASSATPKILLRGPKSGATKTRVLVGRGGRITVEGDTYEGLYRAADLICITLLKMLCGSADCPDAAACATGGNCGC